MNMGVDASAYSYSGGTITASASCGLRGALGLPSHACSISGNGLVGFPNRVGAFTVEPPDAVFYPLKTEHSNFSHAAPAPLEAPMSCSQMKWILAFGGGSSGVWSAWAGVAGLDCGPSPGPSWSAAHWWSNLGAYVHAYPNGGAGSGVWSTMDYWLVNRVNAAQLNEHRP